MQFQEERKKHRLIAALTILLLSVSGSAVAQQGQGGGQSMSAANARVVEYWTSERRANAIPRDLVIDSRGLGYLRRPDGSLRPHGHQIAAVTAENGPGTNAKPPGTGGGGGSDRDAPVISDLDPDGITIGAAHTFSATITDESAIRIVYFTIIYPNGLTTQTFQAVAGEGDTWSLDLEGFFDGNWQWYVVAKDDTKWGGNSGASPIVPFTVDAGGGGEPPPDGGGDSDSIINEEWTGGGPVQAAAGRIYFELPDNAKRKGRWVAYVCSGTAVTDDTTNDRSLILTASHCVYDDSNQAFARNVLFIPDQAGTSGNGTDLNCSNDPIGCWTPSFGVVDTDWTTSVFPANIAWDYGFYVVGNEGAHSPGINAADDSLEAAAGTLDIEFSNSPYFDDGTPGAGPGSPDFTHALGYSYNFDPNFMFCADDMTTEGAVNWWLPNCGLSGGSSGGPWIQPLTNGDGSIISVNSWGYIGSLGMAGPKLFGTSAECVFDTAESNGWLNNPKDGDAGVAVDCP
jgi:hypothetical protein